MGIYNFESRFVPWILAGEKTHTIRAPRRYPDKPGNMLHLYTGLRHPGARLLMRARCVDVEEISIRKVNFKFGYEIKINGLTLDLDEAAGLAIRDGFTCLGEMMDFWKARLPFSGHVIHWKQPVTTKTRRHKEK